MRFFCTIVCCGWLFLNANICADENALGMDSYDSKELNPIGAVRVRRDTNPNPFRPNTTSGPTGSTTPTEPTGPTSSGPTGSTGPSTSRGGSTPTGPTQTGPSRSAGPRR